MQQLSVLTQTVQSTLTNHNCISCTGCWEISLTRWAYCCCRFSRLLHLGVPHALHMSGMGLLVDRKFNGKILCLFQPCVLKTKPVQFSYAVAVPYGAVSVGLPIHEKSPMGSVSYGINFNLMSMLKINRLRSATAFAQIRGRQTNWDRVEGKTETLLICALWLAGIYYSEYITVIRTGNSASSTTSFGAES